MKYTPWPKRDLVKNYFQLPNEIFLLGLSPGALAVYSYLLCCENRKNAQHLCHRCCVQEQRQFIVAPVAGFFHVALDLLFCHTMAQT